MKRIYGMARFIRLDRLHRELMYLGWDQLGLTQLQKLRDEVEDQRRLYSDPTYAEAEEAANGR